MRKGEMGMQLRFGAVTTAAILSLVGAEPSSAQQAAPDAAGPYGPNSNGGHTATKIKHAIIIIGENRTFDHVFATYKPKAGETVWNLLSEDIVKDDGSPGPNYSKATQSSANSYHNYVLAPPSTPYKQLPPAIVGGPSTPYGCQLIGITTGTDCNTPANVEKVKKFENGLAPDYYQFLLTGGTGQTSGVPDARIWYDGQPATSLPPGVYQLTQHKFTPHLPYDAYASSPVHRLFQMWQEMDCSTKNTTAKNPSGCLNDLFAWVEDTVGAGSNGAAPASGGYAGEGSTAPQFFNVQAGDAPYLKSLADTYTMSDNYHQPVMGGTGANSLMMGVGDAIFFSDVAHNAATPPNNPVDPANPGQPLPGFKSALSEVENPNPQPGTNNFYIQDGYGGGSGSPAAKPPNANYGGGSYVRCGDTSQAGVAAVRNYLTGLKPSIDPNCEPKHYYLVNNYNPGYFGNGADAYEDKNPNNTVFTIPPSDVPNIGNSLSDGKIAWAWFGDQYNLYLKNPYALYTTLDNQYCNICNFAQYNTAIMANAQQRAWHLHDTSDFYASVRSGNLPPVSWVKPSGLVDGHPASSKLNLFEGFVKKIVEEVKANSALWNDTAIFVTVDEGGGYYDSGYVQPLDFFGDGTRIPMIAVSKYSEGGHITHSYTDHVSTMKFIEANWGLTPVTSRSRDNLPNPVTSPSSPYVPTNRPAIGDLMDMFSFQ
jgi:phospholipase C